MPGGSRGERDSECEKCFTKWVVAQGRTAMELDTLQFAFLCDVSWENRDGYFVAAAQKKWNLRLLGNGVLLQELENIIHF